MPGDTLITKVHGGMRIILADGVYIGKAWQIHSLAPKRYNSVG